MAQELIAATATAAEGYGWTTWADNILVDASAVASTAIVYIATDGTAASATTYTYAINGGQVTIVANRQPKLDALQYVGHGGLDENPQTSGYGITTQSVPASLYTGSVNTAGDPTYVSVILSTGATGANLGVEQR